MPSGLTVSFVGNVTRDIELRRTGQGKPWARFSVAVNRSWRDRDGNWQERVEFVTCKAWGDLAENLAATAGRGTRLVVLDGRWETEEWTDRHGADRREWICTVFECGPSLRWAVADVRKTRGRDASAPRPPAAPPPGDDDAAASPPSAAPANPYPAGGAAPYPPRPDARANGDRHHDDRPDGDDARQPAGVAAADRFDVDDGDDVPF